MVAAVLVRGDTVVPHDVVLLLPDLGRHVVVGVDGRLTLDPGLDHAHERRLGADVLRTGDVDSKCKNNFVLVTKREIYPSVTSIFIEEFRI